MSAPPPTQHCASTPAAADSETAAYSNPQSPSDRRAAQTFGNSSGSDAAATAAADDGDDHHESDATVGRTPPAAQPPPGEMGAVVGMVASTVMHGADAATSATADAPTPTAADTRPPSAADRLHRHALESVFAFLDLRGLTATLRVSRGWLAAVGAMRRMDLTVKDPAAPIRVVARSAMGRHVGAVGALGRLWRVERVQLNADTLFILTDRMAHLRRLYCELAPPPPAELVFFPAQLRLIHISFSESSDVHVTQVNAAIAAISRLPLLEELDFRPPAMDAQIDLTPLKALPLLRSFGFLCQRDMWAPHSDALVDQLRAMSHLHKVDVSTEMSLMQRLLRQPHDLQWRQISLPKPLHDEAADLLPLLPSLTRIDETVRCQRFEWLRGLPNLTDVHLRFYKNEDEHRAASLVAGLRHCANIEILKLQCCYDLTAAHLVDLLPRLPRLRELTLCSLDIDSLSFLAQPPLTTQLVTLKVSACHLLPLSDLRHVHALRNLHTLWMMESFVAPLGEHERSLLTPPSFVLPLLAEFGYEEPDPNRYD